MSSDEKLLPCPFCGGNEVAIYANDFITALTVKCERCEFYGPEADTDEGVALKWNQRATPLIGDNPWPPGPGKADF